MAKPNRSALRCFRPCDSPHTSTRLRFRTSECSLDFSANRATGKQRTEAVPFEKCPGPSSRFYGLLIIPLLTQGGAE